MDKILLHIEKLLVNNDFVVIPELGGFVVQIQTAQISAEFISSPGVTLGFNSMIKQEDGLLALSLSKDLNIAYRESANLIRKEMIRFKSNLNPSSSVNFGNLGNFKLDQNGKLQFEPSSQLYFLPGNLGACSLRISNTSDQVVRNLNLSNGFMKYVAILIVTLGLFFTSGKLNNGQQLYTADLVNFTALSSTATEEPVIEVEKNYHIVVAAFYSQRVSEKFCNELKNNDFANAMIISGKKINKIAINSFVDQTQAEIALKQLRSSHPEYKDAWILKN